MIEISANWYHSVHMKETRLLTEEVIEKGTIGLVISSEVRGSVPGANVLFGEKEEVRWVPLEFINEHRETHYKWLEEDDTSRRP